MATEILSIPEEHLQDVIHVIRFGLIYAPAVNPDVYKQLTKWCAEEEAYLKGGEK